MGVVGNLSLLAAAKNVTNRSTIDKVILVVMMAHFVDSRCSSGQVNDQLMTMLVCETTHNNAAPQSTQSTETKKQKRLYWKHQPHSQCTTARQFMAIHNQV